MARQVFYSFHFKSDASRVSQIRNIGKVEENKPDSDQAWEKVKSNGDKAIKDWIAKNMKNRSCVVVLIGKQTNHGYYVRYEIEKAWDENKSVLGIHTHNLKNLDGEKIQKGKSPFAEVGDVKLDGPGNKENMDNIVPRLNPPYRGSQNVYNYIRDNIEGWIENAITIRNRYP